MAVDYLHRLIVKGPHEAVRAFRRQMHREYSRTVAGHTWTEVVPFSFAALYELAPRARRIEREIPFDPYELSAWPVQRLGSHHSATRYQFQTRNLEMIDLVRTLSRALPSLTFTMATLCFDDSSVEVYRLSRGTVRRWAMTDRRQKFHWGRARQKFRLVGDDVYDDENAEHWVEEEILAETLGHWDAAARRHRYRWWNQPRLRDLATERKLTLYEVADALALAKSKTSKKKRRPRVQRKSTRRA